MMETPVFDWVAHHALTRPNQVAFRLLETDETRTWRQLDDRVGRLAWALRAEFGLEKGDVVSLLVENDIRCFEVQFACMRLGALFAPLNFRLSLAELDEQARIVRPRIIVTDATWEAAARDLAERADIQGMLTWATGAGSASSFEDAATARDFLPPRADAHVEDVLHILFTSGTTGIPKGATTTLGAMASQAFNQIEFARVSDADAHVLSPLPLFHGGALHSLCNPVLCFGGQVTICQRFDPSACVAFAGDPANHVTHMSLVPVMYQMMADTPEFAQADLTQMRAALVAGGSVSKELYEAYEQKGVRFSSQYGATETGPTVMALDPARKDKILAGSCGQKAMGVDIRLVDAEGADAAASEPGEVWVRGPAVMRRYFGIDPATGFIDGWFATGDVAERDADGFYYIVGRTKEMYKSGGENVFPLEVEKVLISHEGIEDVAIVAIPHQKWGEVGMAIVVQKPGAALTLQDIRKHCEGKLARYKHPFCLEIIDELPRGPMNKVAKAELKKRFFESGLIDVE